MEPFEIIAAPFDVYVAPVGEAFPAIDADPAGNWTKVGTNGSKNISEDGITVAHEEEIEEFRFLGTTGPLKAVRTSEGLKFTFVLHDVSLEQYAAALNFNSVTDTAPGAGVAGHRAVNLHKGNDVAERAVLLRGPSPYGAGFNMQYECPRAYVMSEAEVVYQKGEPAGLEITFVALEDPSADAGEEFGVLRAQDAVAS